MGRDRVLIVGVSTRAFAESAAAAGWECESVDAFGDLDQKSRVRNLGLLRDQGRPYSASAAVAAGRRLASPHVAYVANLENQPAAVARLGRGRILLGNSPATLAAARDLSRLSRVVRRAGACVPSTLAPGAEHPAGHAFLRKPRLGGGGQGVREWLPGSRLRGHEIARERIEGRLGSMSFLAAAGRARVLGYAWGLAGEPAFGATAYRYCGSLFPAPLPGAAADQLEAIAQLATREFGLVGLNGLDFILQDETVFVLELNPRYCASMELIERATARSLFALHVAACRGKLEEAPRSAASDVLGKAVVWARRDIVLPDTREWLLRSDVRDVPFPSERIAKGHPVCTVYARAASEAACREALAEVAARYEETWAAAAL